MCDKKPLPQLQNSLLKITKNVKNALKQIKFIQQKSTYVIAQ